MNVNGEKICTVCLKVVENDFTKIDEVIKYMFNILLLKLELNITRHPIICLGCVEAVKKCLNFKSICLDTERRILLFPTGRANIKYGIKFIFKEKEHEACNIDEDLGICRLCMIRKERNNFVPLDILWNGMNMFEMLQEYMPEMEFNNDEKPLICASCRQNLEHYFKFIVNCLGIKRKIEVYSKEEENNSMDQVHLGNFPIFPFKGGLECPVEGPKICTIKGESNIFENTECVYLQSCSQLIKHEEFDINEEDINWDIQSKEHNAIQDRALEGQTNIREMSAEHKGKNDVNSNKRYSCSLCPYKHKYKSRLNRHILTHKDECERKVHKCSMCAFESKRKHHLEIHFLTHKDVSEIEMHKCSSCAFETKYKNSLKRHMIAHNVAATKMHKCSFCAYETNEKNSLRAHVLLTHEDVPEINIHKCSFCSYETKRKSYLKSHLLIHKDVSEIKMFKCSLCAYECKRKDHLTAHMWVHNISNMKLYKCSFCDYTAKQKKSLRNHLSKHKDVYEITM